MNNQTLRRFARLGAEHRILEIRREISEIVQQFPDLESPRNARQSAFPPNELAALGGRATTGNRAVGRRKRWKMSAAQRKAVSARMREYWAARRHENQ